MSQPEAFLLSLRGFVPVSVKAFDFSSIEHVDSSPSGNTPNNVIKCFRLLARLAPRCIETSRKRFCGRVHHPPGSLSQLGIRIAKSLTRRYSDESVLLIKQMGMRPAHNLPLLYGAKANIKQVSFLWKKLLSVKVKFQVVESYPEDTAFMLAAICRH